MTKRKPKFEVTCRFCGESFWTASHRQYSCAKPQCVRDRRAAQQRKDVARDPERYAVIQRRYLQEHREEANARCRANYWRRKRDPAYRERMATRQSAYHAQRAATEIGYVERARVRAKEHHKTTLDRVSREVIADPQGFAEEVLAAFQQIESTGQRRTKT